MWARKNSHRQREFKGEEKAIGTLCEVGKRPFGRNRLVILDGEQTDILLRQNGKPERPWKREGNKTFEALTKARSQETNEEMMMCVLGKEKGGEVIGW